VFRSIEWGFMGLCLNSSRRVEEGQDASYWVPELTVYVSAIGGFEYAVDYLFTSLANYTAGDPDEGTGDYYTISGALANQYMVGNLID
jgi:hypothetical protein